MSATTFQLVDLSPLDTALVDALVPLSVRAAAIIAPRWLPDSEHAREEIVEVATGPGACRALLENGVPRGWAGAEQSSESAWELHPLLVDPDRHRAGIGRRLVEDIERHARDAGALTMELSTADATGATTSHRLSAHDLAYYPRHGVRHTLTNAGQAPLTYLMFKWRGIRAAQRSQLLTHRIFSSAEVFGAVSKREASFRTELLFEGETEYLRTLHCHVSEVAPGGGYAEHIDAHDVAILLLSGEVETLGQTASAPSVIYYAGGQKHGLSNNSESVARYLVIEFHGQRNSGLLPTRYDTPAIKAWTKQVVKRAMLHSVILEGVIRRIARVMRRR